MVVASPPWNSTSPSRLTSTNFDDHSLETLRQCLSANNNDHFVKLSIGLSGTKSTQGALQKLCSTLQHLKLGRFYFGLTRIRLSKEFVAHLVDLCSTLNAEFVSLSCFMFMDWDKHDYEMIRTGLSSNAHLKSFKLNFADN